MRTTVDLPDDLLAQARSLARDTHRTLSETVADLITRGLRSGPADGASLSVSPVTGFTVIDLGRPITSEDARSLDDDE